MRGYTLMEVTAVVAIVGIMAALATYGVRRYLSAAKSAEAKEMVGAIAKASVAAFARDRIGASAIVTGGDTSGAVHSLCNGSDWVPAAVTSVKARKYQPNTAEGEDFQKGDDATGWKCLRFGVTHPMMYQLRYRRGDGDLSNGTTGLSGSVDYFVAQAQGDTDGDGAYAWFQLGGVASADSVNLQTAIWAENDTE